MADRLRREPGVHILNDVVLNQVLVRILPPAGINSDEFTRAVIARVQNDGTCWLGGTLWRGQQAMRVSVSNWSTTEEDIDRSAAAILAAVKAESDTQGRS
jgi:glutamate/tyrosine decarboxylase-like PLP-dependent enzyme